MQTRVVLIAISFFAATMTSAVAHAQQSKQEEAFCTALTRFHADLTTLQQIEPSSTMAELRAASDRVAKDADEVQKTAHKIKSPAAKQFTNSTRQLRDKVQALPQNMTVNQAKSRIDDDLKNVQQSAQRLATESGCPEAATEQRPHQGQPPGTTPPSE